MILEAGAGLGAPATDAAEVAAQQLPAAEVQVGERVSRNALQRRVGAPPVLRQVVQGDLFERAGAVRGRRIGHRGGRGERKAQHEAQHEAQPEAQRRAAICHSSGNDVKKRTGTLCPNADCLILDDTVATET